MVTVKKLLHEIFTEDTIKALAIGFMADDPREKSNYPSDMPYSEFKRLITSKSVPRKLNDTEENRRQARFPLFSQRRAAVFINSSIPPGLCAPSR